MKVLIVDDNFKLRENIIAFFEEYHILSEQAHDGAEALEKCIGTTYDVIILDVNMPHVDGRTFIKELRDKGQDVAVLALTSNTLMTDKLEMFQLGVDDYMTKPFDLEELLARVRALHRRKTGTALQPRITLKNSIVIDLDKCHVYKDDIEVHMPNKEYRIIEFLATNRGLVKTKGEILEHVWGERQEVLNLGSMTFEVHISNIRFKLGKDIIRTMRGIGYMIE